MKETRINKSVKEKKADKWFWAELVDIRRSYEIHPMALAKIASRLEIYKQLLK